MSLEDKINRRRAKLSYQMLSDEERKTFRDMIRRHIHDDNRGDEVDAQMFSKGGLAKTLLTGGLYFLAKAVQWHGYRGNDHSGEYNSHMLYLLERHGYGEYDDSFSEVERKLFKRLRHGIERDEHEVRIANKTSRALHVRLQVLRRDASDEWAWSKEYSFTFTPGEESYLADEHYCRITGRKMKVWTTRPGRVFKEHKTEPLTLCTGTYTTRNMRSYTFSFTD